MLNGILYFERVVEVSVIVPIFNGEKFVSSLFKTLTEQSFKSFEVIIVNDGSIDRTLELVHSLSRRSKQLKVKVVSGSHAGLSAARNRGIAVATGKYLAFLDCDDTWSPSKLQIQVRTIKKTSAVAVFGEVAYFDGDTLYPSASRNQVLQSTSPKDILIGKFIVFGGGSNILCTRELIEKVGGFDESLRYAEDLDMWLRFADVGSIIQIPEYLVQINVRQDSMQRNKSYLVQMRLLRSKLKTYRKWNHLMDQEIKYFLINQFLDSLIYSIRSKNVIYSFFLIPVWINFLAQPPNGKKTTLILFVKSVLQTLSELIVAIRERRLHSNA